MTNDVAREVHRALYYKEVAGFTRLEIAQAMGVPLARVKTRLGQVFAAITEGKIPHADEQGEYPILVDRASEKEAQIANDSKNADNRKARESLRREYSFDVLIEAFKELVPPIPPTKPAYKIARERETGEELWATVSDLHLGKRTKTYNSQVASEILTGFIGKVVRLALDRGIKHINLGLQGDILDGINIYKAQVSEVDATGTEQFLHTIKLLAMVIRWVLSNTDFTLDIIGVKGNHGDVSRLERSAEWENWEWLLYKTLEAWFAEEPRVRFMVQGKEDFCVIHKRVLHWHGHEISGEGSLEAIKKRVTAWVDNMGDVFDVAVNGHFHRFMVGTIPQDRFVLSNGCAPTDDTFIQKLGANHSNRYMCFTAIPGKRTKITSILPVGLYDV